MSTVAAWHAVLRAAGAGMVTLGFATLAWVLLALALDRLRHLGRVVAWLRCAFRLAWFRLTFGRRMPRGKSGEPDRSLTDDERADFVTLARLYRQRTPRGRSFEPDRTRRPQ